MKTQQMLENSGDLHNFISPMDYDGALCAIGDMLDMGVEPRSFLCGRHFADKLEIIEGDDLFDCPVEISDRVVGVVILE